MKTKSKISFALIGTQILCLVLATVWLGCDGGLDPTSVPTVSSFGGTIRFVRGANVFPPRDSVVRLTVVAFKQYPPTDILNTVLRGDAVFLTDTLPYGVAQTTYSIQVDNTPVEYKYIVVGQQYGANINADWRVVGVYTLSGDKTKPSGFTLLQSQTRNNIDIDVDFFNLPPQPF